MNELFEIQPLMDKLPKICLYTQDTDFYSQFYEVFPTCDCGHNEWYSCLLEINVENIEFDVGNNAAKILPKRINRCRFCHKPRLSKLNKKVEHILNVSDQILGALKKMDDDEQKWFPVIGNIYFKLGVSLHGEKFLKKFKHNMEIKT